MSQENSSELLIEEIKEEEGKIYLIRNEYKQVKNKGHIISIQRELLFEEKNQQEKRKELKEIIVQKRRSIQKEYQQIIQMKKRREKKPEMNVTENDIKSQKLKWKGENEHHIQWYRKRYFKDYHVKDILTYIFISNEKKSLMEYLTYENCFFPKRSLSSESNPIHILCQYLDVCTNQSTIDQLIQTSERKGNICYLLPITFISQQNSDSQWKIIDITKYLPIKPAIPIKYIPIKISNDHHYFIIYRFYHLRYNIDDLLIFSITIKPTIIRSFQIK